MPVVATTGAFGFQEQKTVKVPQLQLVKIFDQVVDICRGAEADSHGPVQENIKNLQLQYTDKVIDVGSAGSASSRMEKTAEVPQMQ